MTARIAILLLPLVVPAALAGSAPPPLLLAGHSTIQRRDSQTWIADGQTYTLTAGRLQHDGRVLWTRYGRRWEKTGANERLWPARPGVWQHETTDHVPTNVAAASLVLGELRIASDRASYTSYLRGGPRLQYRIGRDGSLTLLH